MAKKTQNTNPFTNYSAGDFNQMMFGELSSILTDYVRQYIGSAHPAAQPGSGVFINWDRVYRTQTYQELAQFDLYDEIERDPTIAATMQARKYAVAGQPWIISAPKGDEKMQAMADFVRSKLEALPNFSQDMFELLDAVGKGFAWSEILWRLDPDGTIGIQSLMNRPQRRLQFDAATRIPKLRKVENPFFGDPLPERKFIIHRSGAKYENPFGDAIDQSLYWPWLFKRTATKFWLQFLETSAAPIPIVTHPPNANQEAQSEALTLATNIRNGSGGRMPNTFEIVWAEAKNSSSVGETYEKCIRFFNEEVVKRIASQTLTMEASGSSGSGSKALGSVHNDVRSDIARYDSKALEGTLNSTLIPWLIDFRFGEQEIYPRFQFEIEESMDLKADSEMVRNLFEAGKTVDDAWVEEHFQVKLSKTKPLTQGAPQ